MALAPRGASVSARLLRRNLRRIRQSLRFGSLASAPIFFANSFPKSGTHLLTQVLQGFTRLGPAVDSGLPAVVTFDGFTGRQRAAQEIIADLERLLPGDIAYGHVHAFPAAIEFMRREGVAAYFILRDPRDVVVSHVHYVAEMAPSHIHHRYYHEILPDFERRLAASIAGVPAAELEKAAGKPVPEPLPDILSRFEPFMDWLEHAEVLALRYEDFVGDRKSALVLVLEHALRSGFKPACSTAEALQILEASIDPGRSPTFRSGKIGGWQSAMNATHKVLFKEVSGDLLVRLGYETSSDW
jgi:hypothetical protein